MLFSKVTIPPKISGVPLGPLGRPLLKIDTKLVATADCNSKESNDGKITDRMICAGDADGSGDSCQGDSGGPMTAKLPNGQERLIGVVSWGEGCGVKNKYGVYSRLSVVRDWIDQARDVLDLAVK